MQRLDHQVVAFERDEVANRNNHRCRTGSPRAPGRAIDRSKHLVVHAVAQDSNAVSRKTQRLGPLAQSRRDGDQAIYIREGCLYLLFWTRQFGDQIQVTATG